MSLEKDAAVPKRLKFELVRPVSGSAEPVVIKTKMINKNAEIVSFPRLKPVPRAYFVVSFIKRTVEKPRFILGLIPHGKRSVVEWVVRCNAYWSESLSSLEEDVPKFSRELENLKMADDMIQEIQGFVGLGGFKIDATMLKVILVVFAMSTPFCFFMDVLLHLVPSQIVNWSP